MRSGWGRFLKSLCLGPACLGLHLGGGPLTSRAALVFNPVSPRGEAPCSHTHFISYSRPGPVLVYETRTGLTSQNRTARKRGFTTEAGSHIPSPGQSWVLPTSCPPLAGGDRAGADSACTEWVATTPHKAGWSDPWRVGSPKVGHRGQVHQPEVPERRRHTAAAHTCLLLGVKRKEEVRDQNPTLHFPPTFI